jgi:hypothetical protein
MWVATPFIAVDFHHLLLAGLTGARMKKPGARHDTLDVQVILAYGESESTAVRNPHQMEFEFAKVCYADNPDTERDRLQSR